MSRFLIIDANAIGYSGQQATRLTSGDRSTQAIFHYMKSLRGLRRKYPAFKALNCWDEKASWRYELYPEYKGQRDKYPDAAAMRAQYKEQRPIIEECLRRLGVPQVRAPEYEADDCASILARRVAKTDGAKAVLVTGDQDWLQLVTDNVTWFDPIRENMVTQGRFQDFTGYQDAQQFVQAKALQGDTSDNIKGVGGLGEKAAKAIMSNFGDLQGLIKARRALGRDFEKGDLPDDLSFFRKKINDFISNTNGGIDAFRRNYKLMSLLEVQEPEGGLQIDNGAFNPDDLYQLFEELAFFSLLKDFDNFISDIRGTK